MVRVYYTYLSLRTFRSLFRLQSAIPLQLYTLSLHDALPIWRFSAISSSTSRSWLRVTRKAWCSRISVPVNSAGTEILEHHRSEEHTSELQSRFDLVCRLLLEKKKGFDGILVRTMPPGSLEQV